MGIGDVVSRLLEQNGIQFDVDLSDNDAKMETHVAKIEAHEYDSSYFLSLYNGEKVIWLAMNMNFKSGDYIETDSVPMLMASEGFAQKLARGLTAMAENDGSYYVHCVEGKDRTGYFCMVVEALAGATYQEIIDDYMLTYDNYYGINKQTDPQKYNIIKEKNIDVFLEWIVSFGEDKSADITTADLEACVKAYMRAIGMTDEQIATLKHNLVD